MNFIKGCQADVTDGFWPLLTGKLKIICFLVWHAILAWCLSVCL